MPGKAKHKKKRTPTKHPTTQQQGGSRPRKETPAEVVEEHFVHGLLVRREAARSQDGRLPPGATHEIVDDGGEASDIIRRRFSAA
jgi:hypothetical protein